MGCKRNKNSIRIFLAELLGIFVFILIGDGSVAQVVLGAGVKGNDFFGGFLNIAFGYGLGVMVGILISGGISGGHINPAVTLSMMLLKKIEKRQVLVYLAAQYLGAFLAAVVLRGVYADAINITEGGSAMNLSMKTAGIFATYPFHAEFGTATLVFDQLLGTALFVIVILAVTDSRNMSVAPGLVPLLIGLGLIGVHLSFGLNSGTGVNPARDLAPRIFSLMAGWPTDTFSMGNYWFWIPTFLPYVGGAIGSGLYYAMIEMHYPDN